MAYSGLFSVHRRAYSGQESASKKQCSSAKPPRRIFRFAENVAGVAKNSV